MYLTQENLGLIERALVQITKITHHSGPDSSYPQPKSSHPIHSLIIDELPNSEPDKIISHSLSIPNTVGF